VHLRLFCHAQGSAALDARQVRDAALNSRFPSRAALQAWLARAFGTSQGHLGLALHHALRAAALCPVHGQTYLCLAALTFLEGPAVPDKDRCIRQALALRPFDGTVLFEAGQEAALANDPQAAYAFFRRSFQCGSRHQDRLIRLLAPELPAASFLELFSLDLRALGCLEDQYRKLNRSEDLRLLLGVRAEMAARDAAGLRGDKALQTWLSAASAYRELGQYDACVRCLEQAMQWGRSDYAVRYQLATCLFEAHRYSEAEEHLAWCQQRTPDKPLLRPMLEKVVGDRLSVTRHPDTAKPN
jgi:tetratricopeptide (TPR) repeat protein